MTCKNPDKHNAPCFANVGLRPCGCPVVARPFDAVKSTAPVTASPNEDRFPR